MWGFYKAVLLHGLANTPAVVSGNWVGAGASVFIFAVTFLNRVKQQRSYKDAKTRRERLAATREHWKENAWHGVKWTGIVWIGLFLISLTKTVYADHLAVVADNARLAQRVRSLETSMGQLAAKNEALEQENKQLASLRTPFQEPKDSLRRRTVNLADEYANWLVGSLEDKSKPPDAFPSSADPNPSEERKAAIRKSQEFYRSIEDYYFKHFKERFVGIVREYNSKGVKTGFLENDFSQRRPYIPPAGSVMEGMDPLSQFRDLAFHVDARDHLIVF